MRRSFSFWLQFVVLLVQLWLNGTVGWNLVRTIIVGIITANLVLTIVLEWKKAPK